MRARGVEQRNRLWLVFGLAWYLHAWELMIPLSLELTTTGTFLTETGDSVMEVRFVSTKIGAFILRRAHKRHLAKQAENEARRQPVQRSNVDDGNLNNDNE